MEANKYGYFSEEDWGCEFSGGNFNFSENFHWVETNISQKGSESTDMDKIVRSRSAYSWKESHIIVCFPNLRDIVRNYMSKCQIMHERNNHKF